MTRASARARVVVSAVALGVAAVGFGGGNHVLAKSGLETGFWWRAQPDSGQLPAPPTVPPNGLWISSNPTGPQAISALRVQLSDTEAAPVVRLHVSSHQGSDPALVIACPTTGSWKSTGGAPGPWSTRPAYDCGQSVLGQLSTDGTLMTFDLSGMITGSIIDVAFTPESTGPSQVSPPPAPPPTVPPAPPPPALPSPVPTVPPTTVPPVVPTSPPDGTYGTFDITFSAVAAGDVAVTEAPPPTTAPVIETAPVAPPVTEVAAPLEALGNPAAFVAPPQTAPPTTAAAPVARPRPVRPVTRGKPAKGRSLAERLLLALALVTVTAVAGQQQPGSGTTGGRSGPGARRPRFTIYDPPPRPATVAAVARTGKPPPIR